MSEGRNLAGVMWMVASGLAFIGVNGIVRHLGTELPSAQGAFLRFLFGVILLSPVLLRVLRAGMPRGVARLYIGRGVVHAVATVLWFYAMARIPVAHVTAIGYLNPVLLLVAGAVLLGERLTGRKVAAVAVAFAGVLVVLRPWGGAVELGHLAQLGAAVTFACGYLFAKQLSGLASAEAIVAMLSLVVMVALLPVAIWVWVPVSVVQMGWLAVVAVLATLGHYLMSRAFRAAPLSVTQPVIFLQLIWASTLGAVVFGEPVDGFVLLGGAMIIAAISYVSWRDAAAAVEG